MDDRDASPAYRMDHANAAGGGYSSFSMPSHEGPPEPGSFEGERSSRGRL